MTLALAHELRDPPGGWTDELLEQIPEGVRYEIEDGHLTVSPQPTGWHQGTARWLANYLDTVCPPGFVAATEGEIRLHAGGVVAEARVPDVTVVPESFIDLDEPRNHVRPDEVLLAVEVVSPGSRVRDRTTKVAVYAQFGIPLYLRIERQPKLLIAEYRLDSTTGSYNPPIEHHTEFRTDDPFPMTIDEAAWSRPPRRP